MVVSLLQFSNIWFIFVRLSQVKERRLRVVKLVFANMTSMVVTLDVSKFVTSMEVRPVHFSNIPPISLTLPVSNPDTSSEVSPAQVRNILPISVTFEVSKPDTSSVLSAVFNPSGLK